MLKNRIHKLLEAGDLQGARELARGVIPNKPVGDITFHDYQRVLTAEIGPFTGKYHLQREDGEYVIPSEGIYRLTGDETSFKVQIHTVPDDVEQAVSELNTQSGTTKSESGESEDTTESTPVNDDSRDGAGFRVKVHKFLS